jgi:hypothetical protein
VQLATGAGARPFLCPSPHPAARGGLADPGTWGSSSVRARSLAHGCGPCCRELRAGRGVPRGAWAAPPISPPTRRRPLHFTSITACSYSLGPQQSEKARVCPASFRTGRCTGRAGTLPSHPARRLEEGACFFEACFFEACPRRSSAARQPRTARRPPRSGRLPIAAAARSAPGEARTADRPAAAPRGRACPTPTPRWRRPCWTRPTRWRLTQTRPASRRPCSRAPSASATAARGAAPGRRRRGGAPRPKAGRRRRALGL